jgi:hypothetical protein
MKKHRHTATKRSKTAKPSRFERLATNASDFWFSLPLNDRPDTIKVILLSELRFMFPQEIAEKKLDQICNIFADEKGA